MQAGGAFTPADARRPSGIGKKFLTAKKRSRHTDSGCEIYHRFTVICKIF